MSAKSMILIPVRNCEGMIGPILEDIYPNLELLNATVVLIDNASNDGTLREIEDKINQLEKQGKSKFTILRNSSNIGYGGSIKKLFNFAVTNHADTIFLIHGDDQSNWYETLQKLKEAFSTQNYDLVICSRFLKSSKIKEYSARRKIGNYFFKFLTNLITGLKMSDPGAAVMVFNSNILSGIEFSQLDSGYMFHPQLNIILFANQLSIKEIPIEWKNATKSEGLNLLNYGTKLLYYLVKVSSRKHLKGISWQEAVRTS